MAAAPPAYSYTCRPDWGWVFAAAFGPASHDTKVPTSLPSQRADGGGRPDDGGSGSGRRRAPALLHVEDEAGGGHAAWGTSALFDELNSKAGLCRLLEAAGAASWAAPPTVCLAWDAEDIGAALARLPDFPGDDGNGNGWVLLKPARACHGDGILLSRSADEIAGVVAAQAAVARSAGAEPLPGQAEWVLQRHISRPGLSSCGRKFSLRSYVVAVEPEDGGSAISSNHLRHVPAVTALGVDSAFKDYISVCLLGAGQAG